MINISAAVRISVSVCDSGRSGVVLLSLRLQRLAKLVVSLRRRLLIGHLLLLGGLLAHQEAHAQDYDGHDADADVGRQHHESQREGLLGLLSSQADLATIEVENGVVIPQERVTQNPKVLLPQGQSIHIA